MSIKQIVEMIKLVNYIAYNTSVFINLTQIFKILGIILEYTFLHRLLSLKNYIQSIICMLFYNI